MSTYTVNQRIFIVQQFYLSNRSPISVQRAFVKEFNVRSGPAATTIYRLINKFETTGSVCDQLPSNVGHVVTARTPENIEKTRQVFETSPRKSIRKAAQQVGISHTSIHRILRQDLQLFPYQIQTHQPLSLSAVEQRLLFANLIINWIDSNDIDLNSIWFSDEAHFHIDGYVNKQNWRIWGSENPHFSIEKSLHPQRLTVWCAISSKGIIGPIFIEGTVNHESYRRVLEENFIPAIQGTQDINQIWFMQDGATPHRTNDVFKVLEEHFDNRVIALKYRSKTGKGYDWPPYSPDLNPCDFFLWGCIKDKVYANNPHTLEELSNAIQTEIQSISEETCHSVIQNFAIRLRHLIAVDGRHIEHVIM